MGVQGKLGIREAGLMSVLESMPGLSKVLIFTFSQSSVVGTQRTPQSGGQPKHRYKYMWCEFLDFVVKIRIGLDVLGLHSGLA